MAARLHKPLWGLALIVLAYGLWRALTVPDDYQQGATVKIMFVHVPAAWMALFGYSFIFFASVTALVFRHPLGHVAARAAAPVGATFTAIALVTGSLWGQPMWGTWWVWDARLTSELVLLFLYLGVIALYASFEDKVLAARAAGILAIVGVVNIPIIKYSVDWWSSLHQPATIKITEKSTMTGDMLYLLILNIFGFGMMIGAITLVRFRAEVLARNGMRPWVRALATQEVSK